MNVHSARPLAHAHKSADTVPVEIDLSALAAVHIQLARKLELEARTHRKAAAVLMKDRRDFHVEVSDV